MNLILSFLGLAEDEDDKESLYKKRDDIENTWTDHNGVVRSKKLRDKRRRAISRLCALALFLFLIYLKFSFNRSIRVLAHELHTNKEECGLIWGRHSLLARNITYINPSYTPSGHQQLTTYVTGCKGGVMRWQSIRLQSMNHKLVELRGLVAACVQTVLAKDRCN